MMREKGLRSTSPIHVHVDEALHAHHVKKGKKKASLGKSSSNVRIMKSTASSRARARSVSPNGKAGPWVPAPGKATRGGRVSWQGNNKMEVNQLRSSDMSTDDEERVGRDTHRYERKINNLMNEVGTLKNEVVLQKAFQEIEHKQDILDTSSRIITRQEVELENCEEELAVTETENKILRHTMEMVQEDADITNSKTCINNVNISNNIHDSEGDTSSWLSSENNRLSSPSSEGRRRTKSVRSQRSQKDLLNYEREKLMKKLIEAEMDGQTAATHVRDLRDMVKRLRDEPRLSSGDQARLAKQREVFLESMSDFESTNRTLRRLLRDQHRMEASGLRLSEQRDVLMRKLADADMGNERLRTQLLDCEGLIADLRNQLRAEKEERLALTNLQSSLESTRGHLQKQLRTKEGDINRMAVQIRSIEGELAKERIEKEHILESASSARNRVERDKDSLKKAARMQKTRAARLEDEMRDLNHRLAELDASEVDNQARLSSTNARLDIANQENTNLKSEREDRGKRITELEQLLDRVEDNAKAQNEVLTARLHEKMTENTEIKLEVEKLKNSVQTGDHKAKQTEADQVQLRATVKQYEKLIDEYKEQNSRTRSEADESFVKLEETSREKERIQREGEQELEKVKQRLHQRLQELEPLPEMLRATELRLHDATEKLLITERRNTDTTRIIAELTAKLEHNSENLDSFRSKCHDSQDLGRSLQSKNEAMERRVKEVEEQNLEFHTMQAKGQEHMHQEGLRLEEKTRESTSLTRQLETALSDNRKQQEHSRDRYTSKERSYQSRIVDLETQLSKIRADDAKLKREKEENERRFNSRLYDLKDRLEQCHSTNRSMQNYVQFLKNSYSNVFGETNPSFPPPPTPLKSYP